MASRPGDDHGTATFMARCCAMIILWGIQQMRGNAADDVAEGMGAGILNR